MESKSWCIHNFTYGC